MTRGLSIWRKGTGDQDPLLKRVRIMNGAVFAFLLLISLTLMPPFFTLGVGYGRFDRPD